MALDVVQDYITAARVLLLDQAVGQYRYPDTDLVSALNYAFLDGRRLRPDLFKAFFNGTALPTYTTPASLAVAVPIDPMYRMAFVYYMVGQAQLRDDENNQDSRAGMFMNKFTQILVAPNG